MMHQMEQMESCMENIDDAKLEQLSERSEQVNTEIEALCARGKRDEAQQRAVAYGREMAENPTVSQLRKCGTPLQGMFPATEMMQEKDYTQSHVCDH